MHRALSISILIGALVATTLVTPASALEVIDEPWSWTLSEAASEEVVLGTEAVHPDLAGPGLDVQAWSASGPLGFPRWSTLLDTSVDWNTPSDVSGGDGIPGLGVPSGNSGSLTIEGPVARWNLDISARPLLSAPVIQWLQTGDAHYSVSTPSNLLTAIGADLSSVTARAWVTDLGNPDWAAFVQEGVSPARGLLLPDGPTGLNVYGNSYEFVQRMLATAPCELDRSAVIEPLLDGDVTAPISDRQQRDLLRCAQIDDTVEFPSGETSLAPVDLPETITSTGWLENPEALGVRAIGLPEGMDVRPIDDGSGGLTLEFTGSAAPQEAEVEIVLWREVSAQGGTIRVEPVTGIVTLIVTAPELAATGASASTAPWVAAALSLMVLGIVMLGRRRVRVGS